MTMELIGNQMGRQDHIGFGKKL